ncbi:MAG: DUF983 domain-containing protein [Hellea sp.]|nr:DUF983 domain-containing protein [Hellea sp.]
MRGRCPRCGEGALFKGFLAFNDHCEACDADFKIEDAGDGPAIFVIFIVGIVIVPMALGFQLALDAPVWLTLLIWGPILTLASIGLLRPLRGIMFNTQWVRNAREVKRDEFK